jgi:hypothetical protein
VRDKCLAKKVLSVERSWDQSLLGQYEARLHRLCRSFTCTAMNASRFDLVIMGHRLLTCAKRQGSRRVTLQRQGGQVIFIRIDGILLNDLKKLCGPGTSLNSLAAACGLQSKGIFPFRRLVSPAFLEEKELPADLESWQSDLNPSHSPTREQIDEARAFFVASGFTSVFQYLRHYLRLDTELLVRSAVILHDLYYQATRVSCVEAGHYTTSSLASLAAQHYLARERHVGGFFPNHARLYALVRNGMVGAVTAVFRSFAGRAVDPEPWVALAREQLERGGPDGGPDEELQARVDRSGQSLADYLRGCNSHLLEGGGRPAQHLIYTGTLCVGFFPSLSANCTPLPPPSDIASQYAASGRLRED